MRPQQEEMRKVPPNAKTDAYSLQLFFAEHTVEEKHQRHVPTTDVGDGRLKDREQQSWGHFVS
jgi:hypothetical protein